MKYKAESLFTKYQIPPSKNVNELRVMFQTDPNKRKDLPVVIKTISNPIALLEEELFTPHDGGEEGSILPIHKRLLENMVSVLQEVSETNVENVLDEINHIAKYKYKWVEFYYYNVVGKEKADLIIQDFLSMAMDEMEKQFFSTIGEISWTKSKKFLQCINNSIPFISWDVNRKRNFEDKLIEYASKLSSLEGKSEQLEERLRVVLSIAELLKSKDMIEMLKFTIKKIGNDYDNNGITLLKLYSKIASLYDPQELLDMSEFINRMMNKYLDFYAVTNFNGSEILEIAELLSKAYNVLQTKLNNSTTQINYLKNFDNEDIEYGKLLSDFMASTSEEWITTYKLKLNKVKSDCTAENIYSLVEHFMSAKPSDKIKIFFGKVLLKFTTFEQEFAWLAKCHKEVNDDPDNARAADPRDIDEIIAKYYWLVYLSEDINVDLFNNIRNISFDVLARFNRLVSSIGPYTPDYIRIGVRERLSNALNSIPRDFYFGDKRVEHAISLYGGKCTSSVSKSSDYIDRYDLLFTGTKNSKYGRYKYEHPLSSYKSSNSSRSSSVNRTSSSSGGCYIATSVYGSYDCPQVWILRRYRDYYLDEHWWGRCFIKIYYTISPTLVKWFGKTRWFKKLFKGFLDKKLQKLKNKNYEDTPYNDKY